MSLFIIENGGNCDNGRNGKFIFNAPQLNLFYSAQLCPLILIHNFN